jgi:hypothetical protein
MWEVFHRYALAWAVAPEGDPSQLHAFARQLARGYRPPMDPCLPNPLSLLIQECWQADPVLRPSMDVVVGKLGNIDRSCVMLDLDAQMAKEAGSGGCCVIS